jgi:hypothetical protein
MWWAWLLVLGIAVSEDARAQLAIGPFTAMRFMPASDVEDMPVFGMSVFVSLPNRFEVSADYQTFGEDHVYDGAELASMATPGTSYTDWRFESRTYQVDAGIHYQPRMPIAQPRLLVGVNIGYESYRHATAFSTVQDAQDPQTTNFQSGTKRLLLFQSLTFANDWGRLQTFLQLQVGGKLVLSGGEFESDRTTFSRIVVGAQLKLR